MKNNILLCLFLLLFLAYTPAYADVTCNNGVYSDSAANCTPKHQSSTEFNARNSGTEQNEEPDDDDNDFNFETDSDYGSNLSPAFNNTSESSVNEVNYDSGGSYNGDI